MDRRLSAFFILLAATAFLGWQLPQAGGGPWGNDEGIYLASAQSLASGHAPYRTVFFSKPPLYALLLDVLGHLSGWNIAGYRLAMIACALVTLLATAVLGWLLGGPRVAAATTVLLALNPKFIFYARPLSADPPVLTLMLVALLGGVLAIERGAAWAWMVTGGATLAAIFMKPNGGLVVPILGVTLLVWLLRQPRQARGRHLLRCLALGTLGALPVLLLVLPFSLEPNAYQQAVTYEVAGRNLYHLDLVAQAHHLFSFVWVDRGLVILAAIGVFGTLRRPLTVVSLTLLVWTCTYAVFLFLHYPLFSKHLNAMIPPLALFAGAGLVEMAELAIGLVAAIRFRRTLDARTRWAGVFGWSVLVVVAALLPYLLHLDSSDAVPSVNEERERLEAAVRLHVAPGGTVVTDDQFAAFAARLAVVPWFADTSGARLDTGYLTGPEAVAKAEALRPAAVIFGNDRLNRFPEFVSWVEAHYQRVWADGSRAIYLPR